MVRWISILRQTHGQEAGTSNGRSPLHLRVLFSCPTDQREALMNASQMSSKRSAYSLILTINITASPLLAYYSRFAFGGQKGMGLINCLQFKARFLAEEPG